MSDLQQLFGTPHPVALVTGSGAPRVGQTVARTLAKRGYQVVIHAHASIEAAQEVARELQQSRHEAIALTANLSDESHVKRLLEETLSRFQRIDVLVNSAAIWEKKSLENIHADDVRRHFEINTLGTFLCCRHFGLHMAKQPLGGVIVNLGDWAIVRPYLDYAAYFPSKGAIPTLTRNFAVELAARNPHVRVNAVLPGPVMLPADLSEEDRQTAIDGTLVKREGTPQNVADAVVALVENNFITGVCLPVDGGRSVR